jgi:hypothetical protein
VHLASQLLNKGNGLGMRNTPANGHHLFKDLT